MSEYVNHVPTPSLKIYNCTQRFALRRVYCIGRNYAEHALEMGHDPDREPPFYFQKSPDNLDQTGQFVMPVKSNNVQHEVELVVALKSGGRNIRVEDAHQHIFGFALGLDMTRRDLQTQMKSLGRPWEIGKSFEGSAPIGLLQTIDDCPVLDNSEIKLTVNGELRQQGNINQMLWNVNEIIAYLSQYTQLDSGDLIMTGTPAGVGPVVAGDQLVASIGGLSNLEVSVT
ncbi:FAA hydrolase family protein [Alginatibacterium sediminis]|uniref:FAA hydrolase family protein n=1 Tax=Alginatibacterium sediminis TaxID=2164068 RepID=A0A420EAX9_9ALTE|nr:fumarylacetoacetate hydrolase family protein [Alginatibacterium sediminis]RKF17835.1 FAA hydrolase family protein [Alginatibacterium sediminis]